MAMAPLYVKFVYPIDEPHKFTCDDTNIKRELLGGIVSGFIRSQTGAGVDNTPPNELDVYTIKLSVDLSTDHFTCVCDCGNKGLRDGILIDILNRL